MNWEHLRAFVWLRWRLRVNQNKRAGAANVWIQRILLSLGLAILVSVFIGSVLAGLFVLPNAAPAILMLVWDGMILLFLFMWMTELMIELQRSELLSMDKFLHLPVSMNGAFLINYVGSMLSPSVCLFFAGAFGLSIGLTLSEGLHMVVLFPLIAAFLLMMTSLAYQFRGWLASLMTNKRRRRTIVTVAGLVFVLIAQLPTILSRPWRAGRQNQDRIEMQKEISKLDRLRATGQLSKSEYGTQVEVIRKKYPAAGGARNTSLQDVQSIATTVNMAVPPGWLAYGSMRSAEGTILPALLGGSGLALIAMASLYRSYRTTVRLYTGDFGSRTVRVSTARAPDLSKRSKKPLRVGFLEKQLPGLSEEASAITLASFRSLTRAPEAKMLLLTPVIMVFVFGSMFFRGNANPPEFFRPLAASGVIGMILLMMSQLAGNQFGFDRSGFRAYVLAPVARRNILLGKNLALAPLALGMMIIVVIGVQIVYPMRADHFIATLAQTFPMYILYCIIENFLSMLAPMPVRQGTLKPSKPSGVMLLIHFGFLLLFPLALSPTLIPLGIEFLMSWSGWSTWFPAYLVFILIECVAVAALYPRVLDWQGVVFQRREQKILDVVTSKAE